ncbi:MULTISPECIES: hypothetical protein [Streptomyces]|uniref:Uncharacterized protein n=2 Tax=Streptomyces TaxID=1883 RepID=A0A3Q9FYG5_STRLT|nr:hypothetical protein [Streptomyces luteoverticillatus]AZQ71454.1 hypothetical protein EKH77_09770 [Streptomyces luteoverticillatus]
MTDPAPLGQPLLDYAVIAEPFPLYAATEGAPPTTLHIVVSNGGAESVYCREIIFSLPHGDLAQSLVDGDKDGDGSATGWTVEQLDPGTPGLDIALPEGDYEHFRATHQDEKAKVDRSGITITLNGLRISKEPGTARIEIRETATKKLGDWPTSPGYTTCALTKFPAPAPTARDVYDFHAEKPEAASGGDVHLTWRGPSTLDYTISYGSGAKAADGQSDIVRQKDTVSDLKWDGKITRDTTFYLTYTINKATHCLTTTVTVPDPSLAALHVEGDATVDGSATVGSLTAVGAVTAGGALTAKDAVTVTGELTAKGALSAENTVTAAGLLSANGDLTVGYGGTQKLTTSGNSGLDVQGPLTAGGKLTANGGAAVYSEMYLEAPTDILGQRYRRTFDTNQHTYGTALTDGMLTMTVCITDHTGDNDNIGYLARLYCDVGNAEYWVDAPIMAQSGKNGQRHPMSVFVRKGQTISGRVDNVDGDVAMDKVRVELDWFPIGKSLDLQ